MLKCGFHLVWSFGRKINIKNIHIKTITILVHPQREVWPGGTQHLPLTNENVPTHTIKNTLSI